MESKLCCCKGIRFCKLCQPDKFVQIEEKEDRFDQLVQEKVGDNVTHYYLENGDFSGFYLISGAVKDFKDELVEEANQFEWLESQSGRKKQEYGPKVNFKKKKVRNVESCVFPRYLGKLIKELKKTGLADDYFVWFCANLYYEEERGAHIEPHFDHAFIWGDRIFAANLLSDTKISYSHDKFDFELNIPVKEGNVYLMTGKARYEWMHAVKSQNVHGKRMAITMREFSKEYASY